MDDLIKISRRSILTRIIPGAAIASLGLIGKNAFAQTQTSSGGQNASGEFVVQNMVAQAYQNGEYQLPQLPYDYSALEPHISSRILKIHHDKHHRGYVSGLNQTLKDLAELREGKMIDGARLHGLEKNLSFNTGGHVLHTLFWATMASNAGGKPRGDIAEAIERDFSSFDSFKNYFSKVAGGVKGSGWALLAYEPIGDQLMVFQVNDHDLKLGPGVLPLMPLDVWEHAYYLQYENHRDKFIDAWWNVVNWQAVNESYKWVRSRFTEERKNK